jgi:hypothetical protein
MASLMLAKTAYMIVEQHYSFDRYECSPCPVLIPGPFQFEPNSEEEKNEKSKVLVCFYPMY